MPREPSEEPRALPLSDAEATDVLRYWLGSMRYQEALAARPKAQRPEPAAEATLAAPPNLVQPTPGRKYIKLDWAGREAFVSARRGHVELELDVEARGLFEDWLWGVYRRGGSDDDDDTPRVGYLLSFPSLLMPRGELAGLLRCPLELSWLSADGRDFTPPTGAERAQSKLPAPPARCRIVHGGRDADETLPFFVDGRTLGDVLRIDGERLDAFFSKLGQRTKVAPRRLIAALTELLDAQIRDDVGELGGAPRSTAAAGPPSSKRVLDDLCAAVAHRLTQLGSRTRAYPVALVVTSDLSRVTAHAQRDIEAALESLENRALKRDGPLSRYLRGQASDESGATREACLGRFSPAGLTPHQLAALERSLQQRFSAIQGPPGTGKTTLILNRVADALVRKVLPLAAGHAMGDAVLVVTSTNNAAVDNVTTPLGSGLGDDRLPLALRAGSRDVTERVTGLDLETCIAWLDRHREPAAGEFEAALDDFRKRHQHARALRSAPEVDAAAAELAGHALFQSAERLREVWAAKNRGNLLNVLPLALRAAKSSRSLASVLANQNKGGSWLRRLFPAFGCTLLSLGNVFPPEVGSLEQVIIDEAGQCHPGYAVSALLRAHGALVIGDVNQLQPVIGLSPEDERRVLRGLGLRITPERLEPYRTHDEAGTSAQALADRAVTERPTLVDHFRCQPEIAAICERLCRYGLVVRTRVRSRVAEAELLESPVTLVALPGEQRRHLGSWANDDEAREVVTWVQYLLARGISTDEIGVITPFRGQLDLLTRELGRAGIPLADAQRSLEPSNLDLFMAPTRGLSLGTVHRFQGGERSIILLSTTVTQAGSLRFVDQRVNLVNVAASRARDHLITIGHEATLAAGRFTRALLGDARRLERIS
ncbi:MAG TPA: AAA domain-containing protein [Polyangiaceae bacterium]|nr:AAA domain-containing protein [Polyangiaceae bacterium]